MNLLLQVAFIGATSGSSEKTYLRVATTSVAGKAGAFWKIDLKTGLAGGASTTVSVEVREALARLEHLA